MKPPRQSSAIPKHPHNLVWHAIARYLQDQGKAPSTRQIAELTGKSNTSAQNSRRWLARYGYIATEKGKPGLVLLRWPVGMDRPAAVSKQMNSKTKLSAPAGRSERGLLPLPGLSTALSPAPGPRLQLVEPSPLPVRGEIAAGALFEPATETEEYLTLDYAGRRPEDFALRVSGRSMVGDCIPDGAFVVMRPVPDGYEPRPGEIVAVWVEGAGTTLKHFYQEKHVVVLESSNPEVPPQMVDTTEQRLDVQATHLLTHWRSRVAG